MKVVQNLKIIFLLKTTFFIDIKFKMYICDNIILVTIYCKVKIYSKNHWNYCQIYVCFKKLDEMKKKIDPKIIQMQYKKKNSCPSPPQCAFTLLW
jgi:hypothetical protein